MAAWWLIPAGGLAFNFVQSFWDNVVRDQIKPIRGSILYCDYAMGLAEHSGIYVGGKRIINLSGEGVIEYTTPQEFIDGKTAISIYVSCQDDHAVGSDAVARIAEAHVGESIDYNLLSNNCHGFVEACLMQVDFDRLMESNTKAEYLEELREGTHVPYSELSEAYDTSNALYGVKSVAKKILKANTWRVWELSHEELFGV